MHIELHRTFHELSQPTGNVSDDEPLFPSGSGFSWEALLEEHRVVLLSEAGSGKTQEIRETVKKMRSERKAAFFLRLEHVVADFEIAFEEGTNEEFQIWLKSSDPGWLLLDSVDESRLKDPSDFERAIRKIGHRLADAKQRTHLIITGRAPAWRPVTDRSLCEGLFPFSALSAPVGVGESKSGAPENVLSADRHSGLNASAFKIVSLDDLSAQQIRLFAEGKGIADVDAFIDAVERADAWSFTARPQDLGELTEFWNDTGRIGSRFELMQNSIERRLQERDQNRAEAKPLTLDRAREGARLIAAASTLMHEPTIRVPDGGSLSKGLKIESVLAGWNAADCVTLLSRPLFDEAIYGSVRFHHRSVREYLTAEWFAALLSKETSRSGVEQLFFRTQYGLEVVVPSLRPILPWLAIFDGKILDRIRRIAPEIIFEGGDPSRLPLPIRRQILEQACEQLASGASRRSMANFAAIQRFAAVDLTEDVKRLITKYAENEDIQSFLLRMVWQGRLVGALPEAMDVALSPVAGRYARIASFRAIAGLGSEGDMVRVRRAFKGEAAALDREWLAELLSHVQSTEDALEWLLGCLARVEDIEEHKVDQLKEQLSLFMGRVNALWLPVLVDRLTNFLAELPVIERRHCEVSKRFKWLLRPVAVAVERMVKVSDPGALRSSSLSILRILPIASQYESLNLDSSKIELRTLVAQWQQLKFSLFWHTVGEERQWLDSKQHERLTDWWRVSLWSSYVTFNPDDFVTALREIADRPLLDDKLVALSLSFKLYVEGGRQKSQRMLLKKAANSQVALAAKLKVLMRPPKQSGEALKYKRIDAAWKRRTQAGSIRAEKNREEWHRYILNNVHCLREPGLKDPSAIWNGQYYLYERMRSAVGGASSWSEGNWQSLENEFGLEVSRAFRDGAVVYWRRNSPQLISEGAAPNSTPFSTIFGLTGLAIEAREELGWAERLSEAQAEIAFRYAMHELNGFPPWLTTLFAEHPDVIHRLALREVSYELDNEAEGPGSQYLLYDISWSGDWLWDTMAPDLLGALAAKEPKNASNLRYALGIIQCSTISNEQLATLASVKVQADVSSHPADWFAVWSGVAPDVAIDALETRLGQIEDATERIALAMTYVAQLLGGRRGNGSKVRDAFRTPQCLARIYLLIHRHVRRNEDIDRANKGVYSPSLRDEAQDAREHLVALLNTIPGKEAFLSLKKISDAHPDEASRPWFALQAKTKAELDAEAAEWSAEQVRDFNEKFERTPSNHRELFELAVLRLFDLKADLEEGDSSVATILATVRDEIEVRKFIGNWCRTHARGRYTFPQEEELADAKRPDFRWQGSGFDGPVPTELKLADNWTGPKLFERLEAQLGGDYLRDVRSSRGIFLLVYRGEQMRWLLPNSGEFVNFQELVPALQEHWLKISDRYPSVDEIVVIGIDLTKRSKPPG